MLRKYFILAAFLLSMSGTARAQMDKMMFHGGFCYEFVRASDILFPFYGITGGMTYVLVHSKDQFSLGLNPNVNGAVSFTQAGLSALGQVPAYLTVKYGAGATRFNEQRFGLGVGIGGTFSYIYYDNGVNPELSQGFITPTAFAEITIKLRGSGYKLRGHFSLARARHDWAFTELEFSNFGLEILYAF